MNKFGFQTDKSNILFETHLVNLSKDTKILLVNFRDFVLSLGDNVIEEVRPHRIVYAKSLTFRYFLDIYPRNNDLVMEIRKSRKEPAKEYVVSNTQEIQSIKTEITEAYKTI
ncbi:hypothetical protein [Candidatus Nitrosocosmicus arcticus]|uniref:DUF5655 domain-containing protein n=1 Tax=Candidatus Nitrosocosmicus arcticus TaxID=2035267 RepID=A0A557SXH9_9ARCH|nr:hypothetical protein [Candidatus Nitrosocosmicus arcticus]TVP41302.1 hypothetical protein NARC_30016 [Candidatus Nitrosocosmicus arcticus]